MEQKSQRPIKYVKRGIIIILTIILMVVVFLAAYDYFNFYPKLGETRDILQKTNELYKAPPKSLLKLVLLSEGKRRIVSGAARGLLNEFGYNRSRIVVWHIHYALWTMLVNFHLDESEVFSFWCHFATYEDGHGLNSASKYHYGRNLDQLSNAELATVVVIAKNPSFYKANPAKLNERVTELLEKYSKQE